MEVRDRLDMFDDICSLEISIKSVHGMVESFWLMIEFTTKVAHPLDVVFSSPDVECMRIV